jgi:hypothetical protein
MAAKALHLIRVVENRMAATILEYAMRELDMPPDELVDIKPSA